MNLIIASMLVSIMGIVGAYYAPVKKREPATVGDVFFVGFCLGIIQVALYYK